MRLILDLEDVTILILTASTDKKINGRTAIQKLVYFCVNSLKLENDFISHYFGPYSSYVDATLNRLVSLGLVDEKPILIQNGRRMYSYSLTQDGLFYSKKLLTDNKRNYTAIKKIVSIFEKLEGNRINRLSCAAKIHYLARINKGLTIESAIEKAKSLGWELNEKEIINAVKTIKNISR